MSEDVHAVWLSSSGYFCLIFRSLNTVELVYRHLYGLAVYVGFYGDAVECLISDPAARVRSPVRVRAKVIIILVNVAQPLPKHTCTGYLVNASSIFLKSLQVFCLGLKMCM